MQVRDAASRERTALDEAEGLRGRVEGLERQLAHTRQTGSSAVSARAAATAEKEQQWEEKQRLWQAERQSLLKSLEEVKVEATQVIPQQLQCHLTPLPSRSNICAG